MKTEFIIKTAEKRGFEVVRSGNTPYRICVYKGESFWVFDSYNEFYNKLIKYKKV